MKTQTIILPGLPHLEWAPENLTGHGGTEIDGQWYYTYDQAVEAVKQLGDGWRLPTAGEFEALVALGSTWVDKGPGGVPGRWFGGNHAGDHAGSLFLPACGWRDSHADELATFGGDLIGFYWSSTHASRRAYARRLYFYWGEANPFYYSRHAYGFTVRMVRDVL